MYVFYEKLRLMAETMKEHEVFKIDRPTGKYS